MTEEQIKKLAEDKDYLINAELPESSDSYTPIPYKTIIDTVYKICEEKGFEIVGEMYNYNNNAKLAVGMYSLESKSKKTADDPDLGLTLVWTNSYNKQLKFSSYSGAYVRINGNVIFYKPEDMISRKLKGDPAEIAREIVEHPFSNIYETFNKIVEEKNTLKGIVYSEQQLPDQFSHIMGELYIKEKAVSSDQFNIAVKEFWDCSFEYENEDSLWTLFNHALYGVMSKAHPLKWVRQLQDVQVFFIGSIDVDKTEEPVKEEPVEEVKTEDLREQILTDLSPNLADDTDTADPSQKDETEEQPDEDEGTFMSMGKLEEYLPGFKQGDTFELKDEIWEIGKQTVQFGLPGYIVTKVEEETEEIAEATTEPVAQEKDLTDEILEESSISVPEQADELPASVQKLNAMKQAEEKEKPASTGLPVQKTFGEKVEPPVSNVTATIDKSSQEKPTGLKNPVMTPQEEIEIIPPDLNPEELVAGVQVEHAAIIERLIQERWGEDRKDAKYMVEKTDNQINVSLDTLETFTVYKNHFDKLVEKDGK